MSINAEINRMQNDMMQLRQLATRGIGADTQQQQLLQLGSGAVPSSSFSQAIRQQIDHVAEAQRKSKKLAERFELGDPSVDLIDVMIAGQKSSVQFQALLEVRNRLASAYKEIMDMPI